MNLIYDVLGNLLGIIIMAICWVLNWFIGFSLLQINEFLTKLPQGWEDTIIESLEWSASWLSIANGWLPVDMGLFLLNVYLATWVGVAVLKMVVYWVPTLG